MTPPPAVAAPLVINFHGIGNPVGVPEDEAPFWCPSGAWAAFADALAEVDALSGVDLAVTFDDGNLSDISHAMPALRTRGLSATFFVCAGRLGAPGYLGESELQELLGEGMRIGSHGWDHVDLRPLGRDALRRETSEARSRLAEVTGTEVEDFALPFGSYDRRVLTALKHHRRVYSSDAARTWMRGCPVPRHSYTRSWRPADIISLAVQRRAWLAGWRDRVRILTKSLR